MARDFYHQQVKKALIKDGWRITHDPYKIKIEEVQYEMDLAAEPMLAAEKELQQIVVEIKSFMNPSTINEFHKAIGQFVDYSVFLEEADPNRVLFLAIPETIHQTFFQKKIIQKTIQKILAKWIVYNPTTETIVEWIK
jgi:mannosyltransferase OCH1-like enzyme